ncbi:MAG: cell division protein ZapA [Clostridia bacterium]|nr:cell division protein ZapA [Clostridia bacterium]
MKKKYTLVIADVEMNVVTDAPWETVEKIVGILDRKMRDINLKSYRCTKNQAALLCALEYCSEKLSLQDRNAELEEIAEQDAATIEEKDQKIAELEEEIARLQGENEIMHNILERAAASTKRIMGHSEPEAEPAAAPAAMKAEDAPVTEEIESAEADGEATPAQEVEATQEVAVAEELEVVETDKAVESVDVIEPVEAVEQPEQIEAPEQLSVDFEDDSVEESVNTKAAQVIDEIASRETAVPRVKAKAKKTKSRSRVGSMFDLLTFNDV